MRRRISLKSDTCTERCGVYMAGISGKVCAQYPGRSAALHGILSRAISIERWKEGTAEVSREHSRSIDRSEGSNRKNREGACISMTASSTEARAEDPAATAEETRRNRGRYAVVW